MLSKKIIGNKQLANCTVYFSKHNPTVKAALKILMKYFFKNLFHFLKYLHQKPTYTT